MFHKYITGLKSQCKALAILKIIGQTFLDHFSVINIMNELKIDNVILILNHSRSTFTVDFICGEIAMLKQDQHNFLT